MANKEYSSNDIQTLRFPDSLRMNPGVYIGAVDSDGYWLVVRECLDNGLDEFLAGRNTGVALVEAEDGSYYVYDQGFGIPQGTKTFEVNVNGETITSKMPVMQAVFSELHTSGKYRSDAYKTSVGCFVGETKIKLLDGTEPTFEELYNRWQKDQSPIPVYTWDVEKDQAAFSNISHVQLTKYTDELVDVTLDSGKIIRCTPNHPFYVRTIRGIKKVHAEKLTPDMSLVSMRVDTDESGYMSSHDLTRNGFSKERALHRAVYAYYNGAESIKNKHVHHKDRNPSNNNPSNLIALTQAEHSAAHYKENHANGKKQFNKPEVKAFHSQYITSLNKDAEMNKQRAIGRIINTMIRVLADSDKITEQAYNKKRNSGCVSWNVIPEYIDLDKAINLAKSKYAYLAEHSHTSVNAKAELKHIINGTKVTPVESATRASYDAMFAIWRKRIENCINAGYAVDDIDDNVFIECNKANTTQKYSPLDTLCAWTTLDEVKAAYKENRKPRLFKNKDKDAQAARTERSSVNHLNEKSLSRIIRLFVLASRKANDFTEESYEQSRACCHPNWLRGVEAIKRANGCKTIEEVKSFVDNYNHRIVSVKRVKLDKPVPVYDLTVDGTHTYFVDEALVSNSHGMGVKATNALSEFFTATTCYKGRWYTIGFERGVLTQPLKQTTAPKFQGKTLKKGTLIHLKHDNKIFKNDKRLDFERAKSWAEITTYLNPGFTVVIKDKDGNTFKYKSQEGAKEFVQKILTDLKAQAEPEVFEFKNELADVVVSFSSAEGCNVRGYTNGLFNSDGGKHVDSVVNALFSACKPFAKAKQTLSLYDFKEGLVGIVNMHLHKAEFSSQDKLKLTDNRAGAEFQSVLEKHASAFFKKNKVLAQKLCERASKLSELRNQFKASKKMITALNAAKKKGMPAKYAPFDSRSKLEDRELLIVEGDSAAGGLREVRYSYQSLMPLRGKIANIAKNPNFVYTSEEIINILSAIGYDPKLEDPLSKVQIGRMICLADGDEDGCVSFDTNVILCNGTIKSIGQLTKDWEHTQKPIWVWSLDAQGNLHPAQAFDPSIRCYREKEVHVYLDSGDKIVCTLKHPFAMNFCSSSKSYIDDSTWIKYVEAQYLKPGDSIMSAYFKDLPLNGGNTNLYKHVQTNNTYLSEKCSSVELQDVKQQCIEHNSSDKARVTAINNREDAHKVVKVEIKELKEPKPFYCLTVPKYHNFLLADKNGNGICSSNCHINTLLLTLIFKVAPELFEKGMVYIADMPDFYATYKDQVAVGNSVSEVRQKLNAMKAPKSVEINHIKGWGEINSSLMKALAVDKATRKLIKIKALSDHDKVTFIRIMNDDVAYRRQMLGLSENV